MLDAPIATGVLPLAALLVGIIVFLLLLVGRTRKWWLRSVPLALATAALVTAALTLFADHVWHPFADPIPPTAVWWSGLMIAGLGLAVLRPKPWLNRAAAVALAVLVGWCGVVQVNAELGAYATIRAVLGAPEAAQVQVAQAFVVNPEFARPAGSQPLIDSWVPPAGLPANGQVITSPIPGVVSGFSAGDAWIYLPPAYQTTPRAVLPVLVLLSGQPGEPRQWFDGGQLAQTMDEFAAAHHGLAPVVIVPDWLGSGDNPMCVDSAAVGRDFSYLTVDVRTVILSNLNVDTDPMKWAVGGLSAGATCAVELAVLAPELFPTFLAFSSQSQPTIGDLQDTIDRFFDSNQSAYAAINPLAILKARQFPNSAGVLVAGISDSEYGPQTKAVYAATKAAAMNVQYIELPGGHDFPLWSAALEASIPWLSSRLGLTR